MWAEMRNLRSGDTVEGKIGIDGASRSTVFCTVSMMSPMLSSFASDVCI
jgi:hypothetical protein